MAISNTVLTSGSSGSGSVTTASVSPGANKLITVAVTARSDTTPPLTSSNNISVTGNGLTYVQISEVLNGAAGRVLSVFRAMGASPTTGALTITFPGDGDGLGWTYEVLEWSGIDTSGTNGSGAVGTAGTSVDDPNDHLALTIPGTPTTGDVTYTVLGTMDDSVGVTPGTGWADITHVTGAETQHYSQYDVDQDQTQSWSWTPNTRSAASIGFIIKVSGGADTTAPVLTSQAVGSITSTGGTPAVTTDEGNGTIYMVVVVDGNTPSVTQIKAGQNSSGGAALANQNQSVTGTGLQTFSAVTGLSASTAYDCWFVHTDAASNNSTAVKADFTTSAGGGSTKPYYYSSLYN